MASQFSSREFIQDTAGAMKAAENGPVYITERGRPTHVLLTFEAYEQLIGAHHVLDALGQPPGVEDIDFDAGGSDERPQPAAFD